MLVDQNVKKKKTKDITYCIQKRHFQKRQVKKDVYVKSVADVYGTGHPCLQKIYSC